MMAIASSAQTNTLPSLYVHFGLGNGSSAKRLLCAEVHFDRPIFAAGDDYWKLTGHIEQHGTNLVADLVGDTGQEAGSYKGTVTLGKPFFPQGLGFSGGFTPMWFIVSTNCESKPVLEKLKEMDTHKYEKGQ